MPLPIMVRLDDDIAQKLREQAYVEHVSMNRIINDALRAFYARDESDPVGAAKDSPIASTFRERLQPALDAIRSLEHQENEADYRAKTRDALSRMMDCVTAVMFSIDPSLAPKVSYAPKSTKRQTAKEKVEA